MSNQPDREKQPESDWPSELRSYIGWALLALAIVAAVYYYWNFVRMTDLIKEIE
ncbi:MAG: hypothetical protein ABIW79_10065 [Gemmatimonas sp.]